MLPALSKHRFFFIKRTESAPCSIHTRTRGTYTSIYIIPWKLHQDMSIPGISYRDIGKSNMRKEPFVTPTCWTNAASNLEITPFRLETTPSNWILAHRSSEISRQERIDYRILWQKITAYQKKNVHSCTIFEVQSTLSIGRAPTIECWYRKNRKSNWNYCVGKSKTWRIIEVSINMSNFITNYRISHQISNSLSKHRKIDYRLKK